MHAFIPIRVEPFDPYAEERAQALSYRLVHQIREVLKMEDPKPKRDPARYATTDGQPPAPGHEGFDQVAPQPIDPATGQHRAYWVLSESERAKGFVRPVRQRYQHRKCGTVTSMGIAIAETYARDPKFYGATFCCGCRQHFHVAEFLWLNELGDVTDEVLGS